jgi:two-component system OmpR family response regulator
VFYLTDAAHILVVDDDAQIRTLLSEYLAGHNLRVTTTSSGREALEVLGADVVDLVVLDLRLNGEDGMSIARELRERLQMPVIMLTGVLDEADRVMGLELGADDYMTKPFSPRELVARIRTVLRRVKSAAPPEDAVRRNVRAYRFGNFELNLRTRRLKRNDGTVVSLTNGELNLLAALLAAPQRVLTRDQLIDASRVHDNEVYDRAIDIQILRLRRKIESNPAAPLYILTERGVGYLFNAPVEVLA